jgi:hypothetical protein
MMPSFVTEASPVVAVVAENPGEAPTTVRHSGTCAFDCGGVADQRMGAMEIAAAISIVVLFALWRRKLSRRK